MAEGSKTEKATPKKRRDERKKGNVFLSQDAVAVVTLVGSCAALWLLAGDIIHEMAAFLTACLAACGETLPVRDQVAELVHQGILLLVKTVLGYCAVRHYGHLCADEAAGQRRADPAEI